MNKKTYIKFIHQKLELFRNCQQDIGAENIEDKALYEFCRSLRQDINSENLSAETKTNENKNHDNIQNHGWMDLDKLLNHNSIIECEVDGEGEE